MSHQSGAVRRPANDLTSFDISKRSPEQIAQLFARWKGQRKRLERAQEPKSAAPRALRFMPSTVSASAEPQAPDPDALEQQATEPRPLQYSADFAAILATGGDQGATQKIKQLGLLPAMLAARARAARRSRLRWALASAASVIAVTAAAGAALWPQTDPSSSNPPATAIAGKPAHVELIAEPPLETRMAAPFLPAVTRPLAAEPRLLQQIVDAALTRPPAGGIAEAALMPKLKPGAPPIQTASEAAAPSKSASGTSSAPGTTPIVAKPAERTGVAAAAANVSPTADVEEEAAPATHRSAGFDQRGNDRDNFRSRSDTRIASSESERFEPAGSAGSVDPGAGGTAGGDSGSGAGGNAGGSDTDRGASGGGNGPAAGRDTGGRNAGDGDAGSDADRESGGGDSDGGESGGDSGGGLGGASGGALGGARDAIGGALGGVGKAVGGALGGGKGKGAGSDKDKDRGKDRGRDRGKD